MRREWGGQIGRVGEEDFKGSEKTGCKGYINYFDYGDGFMGVFRRQYLSKCTL